MPQSRWKENSSFSKQTLYTSTRMLSTGEKKTALFLFQTIATCGELDGLLDKRGKDYFSCQKRHKVQRRPFFALLLMLSNPLSKKDTETRRRELLPTVLNILGAFFSTITSTTLVHDWMQQQG